MKTYKYTAINTSGKKVKGTINVESSQALISSLRQNRLRLVKYSEPKIGQQFKLFQTKKVSLDLKVLFTRQLATLVNARISILDSLTTLVEQIEDPHFSHIVSEISKSVEQGNTLADSISKFDDVFSTMYINMVKTGEEGGVLDEVLVKLAEQLEKEQKLHRQIVTSMTYPIIILGVAVLGIIFLMVKVIPTFEKIYADMNKDLPLLTDIIISISRNIRSYFYIYIIMIIGIIALIKYLLIKPKIRLWWDDFKLKIPIAGDLMKKLALTRFCYNLALLIKSGVPILTAMELVSKTVSNVAIELDIVRGMNNIRDGKSIEESFINSQYFTRMIIQLISVGEKSGNLTEMMNKGAVYYEEQVDNIVSKLTTTIEPFMIVFLGLVIAVIIFSMYLPTFNLMGSFSG